MFHLTVCYVHCCHVMWKNLKKERFLFFCLFQTWKFNTYSRIIHQASGSTGWKILLTVLLSNGMFELGICLQQTYGGLCHLVGSHSSFFKGKRVSVSLLLKMCFPVIWRKALYIYIYMFRKELKSVRNTEIKLHILSVGYTYCVLVCLQLWCDERKLFSTNCGLNYRVLWPFMYEPENTATQCGVIFKISCIYKYMSLFHNICLKGLYRHKRLCEI